MEAQFILVLSASSRHRLHREWQEDWISLWSAGKLCLIYITNTHIFDAFFRHSQWELSTAKVTRWPLLGRELQEQDAPHFLAWSIPDRLCFTNTQRPYVPSNNFRLTTHQRNQFRKLDGISFLLTQSVRPSQSINFLVLRLSYLLVKRSPVQGARSLTQILIQCLWFCKTTSAPTSFVQWLQYQKGKQDCAVERTSTCI